MKLSLKSFLSLFAASMQRYLNQCIRVANWFFHAAFHRLLVLLMLFIPLLAGHLSAAAPAIKPSNWYYNITVMESFNRNPANTQWLALENQLTAITLEQDQLSVVSPDEHFNWTDTQSLKPSETPLTTFTTKDINDDGIPEIVTGTTEPGYIYIYNLNQGKWSLNHYEKYVWSAIIQIAAGKFDGQHTDLLVQNQEGFLYLLKISDESLDIVWKSPTVWRQIASLVVMDIDNDSKDEIIVCYKTGGIGILKLVNNQIVSAWDNYLWGKALAFAEGDWDNDKQPELFISTTQKVIYILGGSNRNYLFEYQITDFNYIAETLSLINGKENSQLFTTDTSGKLHCYEYIAKTNKWLEQFSCQTGRIARIIPASHQDSLLLWAQNRKLITLNAFKSNSFKLKVNDNMVELNPSAIYQNNTVYIAPKALGTVAESGITYAENRTGYTINQGQRTLEIKKSDLAKYKLNNESYPSQNQFLIIDNNLFLSSDSFLNLLNIPMKVESLTKTIVMTPVLIPTPTPVQTPAVEASGETQEPAGSKRESLK